MDNTKTMELEILIAVSQNRKVPTHQFYLHFEHKWKLYSSAFDELLSEGLFATAPVDDKSVYELTSKGKVRITELIEQREAEVHSRLLLLKQEKPVPVAGWKSTMALLNSFVHFLLHSEKATKPKHLSGYSGVNSLTRQTR